MKATCLNCGFENDITLINVDDLGLHVQCTDCNSSFDVDAAETIDKLKHSNIQERGITISHMNKNKVGIIGHGLHNSGLDHAMYMAAKENNLNPLILVEKDKNDFSKNFHNYLYGTYNDRLLKIKELDVYANTSEPKSHKDYLLENGFDSFEKLKSEYDLIQNKKSKLPSQVRTMIAEAYETVTLPKK